MTSNRKRVGTDRIWFDLWTDGKYYVGIRNQSGSYTIEEIVQLAMEIIQHDIEKTKDVNVGADGCYDGE